MPQPVRLGGTAWMDRVRAQLAARGIADVAPAPTDDQLQPGDPGHLEYRRARRADAAVARWQAAAPHRYRDATATHSAVQAWADRATTDLHDAGFLVLWGGVGTGKTHQAYGALRRIAAAGPDRFEMLATTVPDLYGRLRPGGSEQGTEYWINRYARIPLLLLDDLGTEKPSEFTEEATYRIVNERYNACLPLLITSNLPIRAADGAPGADVVSRLGDRLASRLAQSATVVNLAGADLRRTLKDAS